MRTPTAWLERHWIDYMRQKKKSRLFYFGHLVSATTSGNLDDTAGLFDTSACEHEVYFRFPKTKALET